MANPYIGEIRLFAGNFAPQGWAFCDGSLLGIANYPSLFNVIGTTYGGDGQQNFALPDMRGRVPMHMGNTPIGTSAGASSVTLTAANLPQHGHGPLVATTADASTNAPAKLAPAKPASKHIYSNNPNAQAMAAGTTTSAGGFQPHPNMQPYMAINYIIALDGIYPG